MTIRRLKTYPGAQGFVYQYYFVGQRAALATDPEAPATEFVFDVTSDRKLTYAVSVFLPEKAVSEWAKTHGRPLTEAEQYAAAKLGLKRTTLIHKMQKLGILRPGLQSSENVVGPAA